MSTLRAAYDVIYLAPHLDDAVLSCGGRMAAQIGGGATVLIATIAAGDPPAGLLSPFAEAMHASWGLGPDAVARRRNEDRAACARLGADLVHLPLPDCIYRRTRAADAWRYSSRPDIFGAVHPEEEGDLLEEISRWLDALPATARLVAPLGIGGHVDHQLVRRAAEASSRPITRYYAEQPYWARDPAALDALRAPPAWIEERVTLDDADLTAKLAAVAAYRSQAAKLYPDGFGPGSPGRRSLRDESFWRQR
jgi:LmbE family N-acetylglucosaminyl deacetylase